MSTATRNSVFLIGAYILTSLLNYGFGVALSWFFTPAQFGVLGVAQSLLLLIALAVGSGFAWTAAHDVAALGVTCETRRRFRVALVSNTFLGILLALGLWSTYRIGLLPLGPAYRAVIPLVGVTTVLLSVRAVVNGAARGMYRFSPVALNLVGEVFVKVSAGLALVAMGISVVGVMAAFALGAAVSLIHSLWIVRSGRFWQGPGWFDRQVWRTTAPLFVGMVGVALMLNLDVLGLKLLSPLNQGDVLAGFYQAAVILARTPVFIAQALTLVLFSYVAGTKNLAHKSDDSISGYLISAIKSWYRMLLPAGLILILAPQAALSLFFPEQYQAASLALQIAAAGGLALALVTLLNGVLQAAGERRKTALAAGIATLTQAIVLVWGVPRWGALGAAASLLTAGLVALIGLLPAFKPYAADLFRQWQNRPVQLYRLLLPPLALALPLLFLPDTGRWMVAFKLALSGLTYLTFLFGTRWQPSAQPKTNQPVYSLLTQFVRVLMGG